MHTDSLKALHEALTGEVGDPGAVLDAIDDLIGDRIEEAFPGNEERHTREVALHLAAQFPSVSGDVERLIASAEKLLAFLKGGEPKPN